MLFFKIHLASLSSVAWAKGEHCETHPAVQPWHLIWDLLGPWQHSQSAMDLWIGLSGPGWGLPIDPKWPGNHLSSVVWAVEVHSEPHLALQRQHLAWNLTRPCPPTPNRWRTLAYHVAWAKGLDSLFHPAFHLCYTTQNLLEFHPATLSNEEASQYPVGCVEGWMSIHHIWEAFECY